MYDVTDLESFENISRWFNDVVSLVTKETLFVLIGNKCDLQDKRLVSFEDAKAFADEKQMPFFEISAKSSETIEHVFNEVGSKFVSM